MAIDSPAIDLLSAASFAAGQPWDQFRWLREHDPVHFHPEPDGPGFWALTRHDDVRAVGRDPVLFSSAPTIMIADAPGEVTVPDHAMMLMQDPPGHTVQRKIVHRDFIPRAAEALRPRIRELAAEIIDGVAGRERFDLVEDVAGLMPSYVIAELLGIPHADGVALYKLTEAIHSVPDGSPAEGEEPPGTAAVREMLGYAHTVWEEKRARPTDDLCGKVINGHLGHRPVDEIDFGLFFLLLIDAGGDTTRNLVSGGMHALFRHPEATAAIRADLDGTLKPTIEEMLRWVSPVIYMRRTATADTELRGRTIRAGDKVVMYYGAANRDPEVFADPDRFDPARSPNHHVAFGGGGPHYCLGSHVARVEIEELLRELLTRLPHLAPGGPVTWLSSNFISGPKHLPVHNPA
ncbi:MAG: cytochrome P450 [Streptosporangiales bacterium]|nr:cytochrome P450 [Streptosporangiales bacterium]